MKSWCPLCLFNPSVGSPPLSSSFGPGGGWRAQTLPIIWRLKLLIFGAPAPEPRDPAWMEVLAFPFWFGWRGGGAPCASLTPLLVLLLCPPLLARVAAEGPRPFLLYGASNC